MAPLRGPELRVLACVGLAFDVLDSLFFVLANVYTELYDADRAGGGAG
jgi:hypothetical protein